MALYVDDVDGTVERCRSAGAVVVLPPEDKFFGERYAHVRDPFGHVWALACRLQRGGDR